MERPDFFCCTLDSKQKYEAIHELFMKADCVRSLTPLQDKLEHIVIQREELSSTGFGNGVAVAHGKSDLVNGFVVVLGLSETGIDFNSVDGLPVKFLFMILHPPMLERMYLDLLANMLRVFKTNVEKKNTVPRIVSAIQCCLMH